MIIETPFIPYNTSNKDRARWNRKNLTKTEFLMRRIIRKKKTGYLFLRHKMIDSFILDFYCSKLLLWIEVDRSSHDYTRSYDRERDEKLRHIGIKIIRYQNEDVYNYPEIIYRDLLHEIKIRESELLHYRLPPWERGNVTEDSGTRGIYLLTQRNDT
jgi:very-short-patch-repair endonuclease